MTRAGELCRFLFLTLIDVLRIHLSQKNNVMLDYSSTGCMGEGGGSMSITWEEA
jgi:hypothetical protein